MRDRFVLSATVQSELKRRNLTAEGVLREALNIKNEGFTTPDGKYFPEGTVFLAWYKERALAATVTDGAINAEGKSYSSLSAAAAHYTGRPTTNGWDFWNVRLPGMKGFLPASEAAEKRAA